MHHDANSSRAPADVRLADAEATQKGNMMPKTLQQITDAWGNWMNAQHNGGGIRFTASTNYGSHPELGQYHEHQVNSGMGSVTYDPNAAAPTASTTPPISQPLTNDTAVDQSQSYSATQSTEQSFTWSITESLSVSDQFSVTVGLPEVALSATNQVTVTLDLASTQSQTSTKAQSWTINVPVTVPAYSSVTATSVVTMQKYNIGWAATCSLQGNVAIWFNSKVSLSPNNPHWLWFLPIESVLQDCSQHSLIDTTGYTVVPGGVQAQAKGSFNGGQGISTATTWKQALLPDAPQSLKQNMQLAAIGPMKTPMTTTGKSAVFAAHV